MDAELKLHREKFIRGHTGGTFQEVVALTAALQLSHITFVSFVFAFPVLLNEDNCHRIGAFRWMLDFFLNITPFLLAITALSDYVYHILVALIVIIVINFTKYHIQNGLLPLPFIPAEHIKLNYPTHTKRLPYVANLMSNLMLATCIAILAVDFHLFDRRFAKTEIYGWSLMDVGVGGFISINGFLSPEARFAQDNLTPKRLIFKSFQSSLPMLILGFIRLISVKALNYQEHVSEYGVHWNFFFTIAFTKLGSSLVCAALQYRVNFTLVALFGAIVHQWLLTAGGLSQFILNENREGLIAANKEGLISTIGSICLFLFFVQYGRNYLPKVSNVAAFVRVLCKIVTIGILAMVAMYVAHYTVESTSRRETNFAFICSIVAFISALTVIEVIFFLYLQYLHHLFQLQQKKFDDNDSQSSTKQSVKRFTVVTLPVVDPLDQRFQSNIFDSFGPAGLYMFLLSNLLTGAVNFTFDTLTITSTGSTLAILYGYCLVLVLFCQILVKKIYNNKKNI